MPSVRRWTNGAHAAGDAAPLAGLTSYVKLLVWLGELGTAAFARTAVVLATLHRLDLVVPSGEPALHGLVGLDDLRIVHLGSHAGGGEDAVGALGGPLLCLGRHVRQFVLVTHRMLLR